MGLLPKAAKVDRVAVLLENRDLLRLPAREMTRLRGDCISMILREPMTSLNPVVTMGQLTEGLEFHLALTPQAAAVSALTALSDTRVVPRARRFCVPACLCRQSQHPDHGSMAGSAGTVN
jgi:ABC-type microcin C transport system duplicated ATPase subunit YejF